MDQHLKESGESAKVNRIREIEADGLEVVRMPLVSDLREEDAYRIELQLIAAFGTEANGGILTNEVQPITVKRTRTTARVRPGAEIRVQMALKIIKDEVAAMADLNPEGVTNADVTNKPGLQSSHNGGSINQLGFSILGLLMTEQRVIRSPTESRFWSPRNYLRGMGVDRTQGNAGK